MNIRLLRPVDFNSKLRDRGVEKKITVQSVCRVAKNEKDVREILDEIWKNPKKAKQTIEEVIEKNQNVFEFETKICK